MIREFLLILVTIFLMEIADKTQLSAIAFATKYHPILVYFATLFGLALATLLSVILGKLLATILPQQYLKIAVGLIFIIIGLLTIFKK